MRDDEAGRETGRLMVTLPKERLKELKQLAADSGITLTQAAAQCVSVGLIHLQSVVSPMVLLNRPEFRSFVQQMSEQKALEDTLAKK